MSRTPVRCSHSGCAEPASYKLAANWVMGRSTELKTYGFACSEHIGVVFHDAEQRRFKYVPTGGEVVEELAIYKFEHGRLDRLLQRLWGLERNYRS